MSYNFDNSLLLDLLRHYRYNYRFGRQKTAQRFLLAIELRDSYSCFVTNNEIPEKIKLSEYPYNRNLLINFFSKLGFKIISYKREYGKTQITIKPL